MSSPSPTHSLSSPTISNHHEQVLPTPSSSTTTGQSIPKNNKQQALRQELEQQLTEKKKQLEESSSGIGKNVLARQISQLEERLKEMETQKYEDETVISNERLRNLERDLAAYRKPQGLRNKKEVRHPLSLYSPLHGSLNIYLLIVTQPEVAYDHWIRPFT